MKYIYLLLFSLFISLNLSAQEEEELAQTEKLFGLSKLWEGAKNNFVYYNQLRSGWDGLHEVFTVKVLAMKDSFSYIRELERRVAVVKDGHRYISHSIIPSWEGRVVSALFTTRSVAGLVLVENVLHFKLIKQGVQRGDEEVGILHINDFMNSHFIQLFDCIHTAVLNSYGVIKDYRNIAAGNLISFY